MADVKFYRCAHCGNVVTVLHDGGVTPSCCGEPMELLVAGSTDAATEKHVPALSVEGDKLLVKVGEVAHPMGEDHYISFIALVNDSKVIIKKLQPGDAPETKFCYNCAKGGTVYEYCNLHGLWKADVE